MNTQVEEHELATALVEHETAALRLAALVDVADAVGTIRLIGLSTPGNVAVEVTTALSEYRAATLRMTRAAAASSRPVYDLDDPAIVDPAIDTEPDCCT